MGDVCYFLDGMTSRGFDEGPQECLLWRLKNPENPSCRFIDEPSYILGGDSCIFNGNKAEKNCISFEKDPSRGQIFLESFTRYLYKK